MTSSISHNFLKMARDRSRSPAKADTQDERPMIRPVSLTDMQLSLVRLTAGTKTGVELPQYDKLQRFAIELRDSWLEMPYGLDRGYQGQEPSFSTEGGAPNSCLTIFARITAEQAQVFPALDDRLRSLSREKGAWASMIRGNDEQIVKIKIALGPGVEHTQLSIVESTKDPENEERLTRRPLGFSRGLCGDLQ